MASDNRTHSAAPTDIVDAIQRHFDGLCEMLARGTNVEEVVPYLNWEDSVVVSSGYPHQLNGNAELLASAGDYVDGMGRDVRFELTAPPLAAGDLAAVVARIICKHDGRPDDVSYALYVWERRGGEWKVIREAVIPEAAP